MADVSIQDIFLKHMPERINGKADKLKGLEHVISFKITGAETGEYTLKISGGAATVTAGIHDPQVTITISDENWKALTVTKSLNPMSAFMTGKLKVSGDMGLAMKLGQMGIM